MLNALVDLLGAILDRVTSFVADHWIFLLVLALAAGVAVWRRARTSAAGPARAPAPTLLVSDPIALLLVVLTSLALSIGGAALHGMPLPEYHDDFAYLLDGDTFAHGRLSNPTPALWQHFETMHVLLVPRYIAKFPVGQGLVFAVGMILFGKPLAAIWLVAAAACAAIWWSLRIWTTPHLALLGGLAAAVHPTFLDWTESYHGGALAALGGALLLAGAGRMRTKPSMAISALMGAGTLFLAISRPYEGLVFVVAIAGMMAFDFRREMLRVAPAGAAIVAAGLLFIAYDNWSITGNPLILPYSVYEQQYDPAPNFLWEQARPMPHYSSQEMAFVYRVFYLGQYRRIHAPGGLWSETSKKFDVIERAILGRPASRSFQNAWPLFLVLLVALVPLLREDRDAGILGLALVIFSFAPFSIIWWMELHYLAPATAVVACLVVLLLRRTFSVSPLLGVALAILFFANAATTWITWMRTPQGGFELRRQEIVQSLLARGGKHLVIVSQEVSDALYNGADLDRAPVIWARDLGPESDARLAAHYADRTAWLLERSGIRLYTAPHPPFGHLLPARRGEGTRELIREMEHRPSRLRDSRTEHRLSRSVLELAGGRRGFRDPSPRAGGRRDSRTDSRNGAPAFAIRFGVSRWSAKFSRPLAPCGGRRDSRTDSRNGAPAFAIRFGVSRWSARFSRPLAPRGREKGLAN